MFIIGDVGNTQSKFAFYDSKKKKSLTSSTSIVVVWIKIKNLYDSLIKKI